MDKYGVDEQATGLEKQAAKGCPKCGGKVKREGNLVFCGTHGSEPFERTDGSKKEKDSP